MRSTILHIELALPTAPEHDAIGQKSWLLRAAAAFPDRLVLAFGAPGTTKDASLGRLFDHLKPIEGDRYEIELGAVLHERLPGPENELEYVVAVAESSAVGRTFCLSNVMNIIRYRKSDVDRHAICHASVADRFVKDEKDECGGAPHVEFIPSVVTARYVLPGADAEDALSEGLDAVISDFISAINRIVAALLVTIDNRKLGILTPVYDRGSFPTIYMLIRGADDQFSAQRVATSLLRTALVPQPLPKGRWEHFLKVAGGEEQLDPALKALRSAESYIQAGAYDFALLLTAIAVEVATSRYVIARLRQEGVSKTKLSEVETDLTFNIMLNTQIIGLTPAEKKPDRQLLGTMDRVRKLRNDYLHRGKFEVTRDEVVGLTNEAERYVEYLGELAPPPA